MPAVTKAMKQTIYIFLLAVAYLWATASCIAQRGVKKGLSSIHPEKAQAHVFFLASNELQGRESGKNGSDIASQYIAAQLKLMGILPLSTSGYFQPFYACRKTDKSGRRFQIHPDSITACYATTHEKLSMRNVLGMIPGKRKNEYVIVGAHFDHLGINPSLNGDQIYNGADDNASGVSAVLQIANAFVESGKQPLRNVIFAFWDGEERGLLGSRFFTSNCSFIHEIKGYLNFDMIGRNNKPENPDHVVYFYTEAHPSFGKWLKRDIKKYKLPLKPDYRPWDKPVGGSDNAPFAIKEIPIIWYHTDAHPDYHQPTDHPEKLNWNKVVAITKASFLNVWNLANKKNY